MNRFVWSVLVFWLGLASISLGAEEADEPGIFSDAELEQILAPIALYPDSLLTHILIAATYPLEVIQASRWAGEHPDLGAEEALEQVEDQTWDPSVKALVPFPGVLERLNDDLDWMQTLGEAFIQNEERLLAAIQSLRHKAEMEGNLDKMENMEVSHDEDSIVIESRQREVIFVPYYDTRVVYGHWDWAHYPPVYWDWGWHRGHHHAGHRDNYSHGSLFSWHHGVHLSSHIFFSAFHWSNHHVVVLNRRHHGYRHYNHRRHIVRDHSAERWHHNPLHRRGLAYRNRETRRQAQEFISHSQRNYVGGNSNRLKHGLRGEHPGARKELNRQERLEKQARLTTRLRASRQDQKKVYTAGERPGKRALVASGNRRQKAERHIEKSHTKGEAVTRERGYRRHSSLDKPQPRKLKTQISRKEVKPQRLDKPVARYSLAGKSQPSIHTRREQTRPAQKAPRAVKSIKSTRRSEAKFSAATRHRKRR